jgi:hypothetical protein
MKIIVIGPSCTPPSGVDADTYRALVRELGTRGHDVLLLERGVPAAPVPRRSARLTSRRTSLYRSASDLKRRYTRRVRHADVVIVASPVRDGIDVGAWVAGTAKGVKAFLDLDASATLSELENGSGTAATDSLIPKYDLYLTSTEGLALRKMQEEYQGPMARTLTGADRAATLERYVAEVVSGQLMA